MNEDSRRVWPARGSIRVGHAPRECRRDAPVTVTGEMTAHAPDCQANREAQRSGVERAGIWDTCSPNRPNGGDDAAECTSVPHQTRAPAQEAERIGNESGPVVERLMQPRADQPANEAEHH